MNGTIVETRSFFDGFCVYPTIVETRWHRVSTRRYATLRVDRHGFYR
ncbi:hypothetical protein IQ250_17825 [Pseudanabaenaceae cyanobacterium LEGE 13415]|nr:hypothetical protein [Pseudanabaenaceae cyanobacterium LEGE 13415]